MNSAWTGIDARLLRAGLLGVLLMLATGARAADTGFSAGLAPEERASAGLNALTQAQVSALDALVGRDVILAHEGGVTGFSTAFTQRHSDAERRAAGIEAMSPAERGVLDALAARAIAYGPSPSSGFTYSPPPKPAPVETLVSTPPQFEVHGDVSFTLGGGSHGSSFYGTSADVFVTDPSGRFTLGIGVSEFRSRGLIGPYDPCMIEPYDPWLPGW